MICPPLLFGASNREKYTITPYFNSGQFKADDLLGQFVLSENVPDLPWRSDSIGDWHLAVEESLPFYPIYLGSSTVGWILGHPISPDGHIVGDNLEFQPGEFEQQIYAYGGRFLVILPLLQRVYLDPCGLLSAVYCKNANTVASSGSLIPHDDSTSYRTELIQGIGIPFNNGMFPVGMTARENVERIIPNHYLDLSTWTTHRHWPDRPLTSIQDVPTAIAEIADLIKLQIRAISEDGPATLRLTAGKDSRMLLACAREVAGNLECVTANLNDHRSMLDCWIAKHLAKLAQVRHRTLNWMAPEKHDLELWLFRTDIGTGEYRGWTGTSLYRHQMDKNQSDILGSGGEVARGYYWQPDDLPNTEITTERLLGYCRCPHTNETMARIENWKSGTLVEDSLQLLDFFHIEQDLGCWAGVWSYAEAANSRYQAFPFSHRRILELMLTLPLELRRRGTLSDEIISREWAALLKYPFNEGTRSWRLGLKIRSSWQQIKRGAKDPYGAIRGLARLIRRKLLS